MWQIEKTTKHCQNCTSTIEVGKNYFSALFQNQAPLTGQAPMKQSRQGPQSEKIPLPTNASRLVRQDFCTNCWEKRTASGEEPPFSFWQTKISTPPEPPKTPRQVLLTFFDNLFIKPEASPSNAVGEESEKASDTSIELINPADPVRDRSSQRDDRKSETPISTLSKDKTKETVSNKASFISNGADTKLKSQVKYLFALILLRKRLLKLKESVHKNDMRFLVFERVFDNKIYEIPEITISEQELISLRDEFSKLFEFRI